MQKHTINLLFGLKVRMLRQQHGLTFQQLAEKAGTTVSYLHDIEKGKKYPSGDKIFAIARALGATYDYLVALHGAKNLQPIVELLESDFFRSYPLEMFGLDPAKVIELLSDSPERINAFISTILKIAKNYHVTQENLYSVALRSYQDLHDNYFPELEDAARILRADIGLANRPEPAVPTAMLEHALLSRFNIKVDRDTMPNRPVLRSVRSYFSEEKKILFLNGGLHSAQENFLLGRELGFQYLGISDRPFETILLQAKNFDHLLNNFRASYFSSAFLMDEPVLCADIARLAGSPEWRPVDWLALLPRYKVTAEMLMQRLTNLLPKYFDIRNLFFIRIEGFGKKTDYRMTKELHLNGQQGPHATEHGGQYCRRWVSIGILEEALNQNSPVVAGQLSSYWQTPNTYFCLSMAKGNTAATSSVTIGLLDNEALRRHFRFLDDPRLPKRTVNVNCETCSVPDCEVRAAPPAEIEKAAAKSAVEKALRGL